MKILSTEQIRQWDAYTIEKEEIESIDLMERASATFVRWFTDAFSDTSRAIYVLCGNGNNGGDGLAIARLLHQAAYPVQVLVLPLDAPRSIDNLANLAAVRECGGLPLSVIADADDIPPIADHSILVDALLGSGLTQPLHGTLRDIVHAINQLNMIRIAVDTPTGLAGDTLSTGTIFHADYTFAFEQPKLAFLLPENTQYVGQWQARSIGLSRDYYEEAHTTHYLLTAQAAAARYKTRNKYGHKGNYGHVLMMMGSKGKIGAAVLAARASLRAGCGLTTVYLPSCGYDIVQAALPEAMVETDPHASHITDAPDIEPYDAIGVGCGMGVEADTLQTLSNLLSQASQPLVVDADALNLIAANPPLLDTLPPDSILTPHPKEFERLFGPTPNDFDRLRLQREKAIQLRCYILVKGAHSCIATPQGICYFNTSGNPGMATAGSGDVLTGVVTGLLAQGYSPESAILVGVYIHGLAGDLAAIVMGEESMIASDIIDYLPKALLQLKSDHAKAAQYESNTYLPRRE